MATRREPALPEGWAECAVRSHPVPAVEAVAVCRPHYDQLVAAASRLAALRRREQERAASGDRWLDPREAAALLHRHPRTVHRFIERGRLRCRVVAGRYQVLESSVFALIEERDGPDAA